MYAVRKQSVVFYVVYNLLLFVIGGLKSLNVTTLGWVMQPVSAKVEVRYPIGPVYHLESKLLNLSTDEEHNLAQIFIMICRSWERERCR